MRRGRLFLFVFVFFGLGGVVFPGVCDDFGSGGLLGGGGVYG